MRHLAAIFMLCAFSVSADSFLFVQSGRIISGPRDLPSVGVRLDNGQTVLGLHGASDQVKAACGWFRVIPSATQPASNQVVAARTFAVGKDTAQEVLTFGTRVTLTPEQRLEQVLDAIPGKNDDERVTVLIKAVASAITNQVKTGITITVPAARGATK